MGRYDKILPKFIDSEENILTKMSQKPSKRVEYQKYLRNKLEEERTCKLFGLTENIALVGEEDLVLQREFRIDFLFEKIDEDFPIESIFWYFKKYNLAEFKSVNDPLNLILLLKYLGQLFWWLFARKQAVKEEKGSDITPQNVTLTIITVTSPRNVLSFLENIKESIQFVKLDNGHYRWSVMAIEVHLLVINELLVTKENYGWLSFAEGRKYVEYREKLIEEIAQNYEMHQIYFELLTQLEEEGKERMASDVMLKYFSKMPLEKQVQFIREEIAQLEEKGNGRIAYEIMQKFFSKMPLEKRVQFLKELAMPDEVVREIFDEMPDEDLQKTLAELPPERLQKIREIVLELSPKQN